MMQWDSVGRTPDSGPRAGWDGPLSVEPSPVDATTEAEIQASVKHAMERVGPHPRMTPAELAAHVHDLLAARGEQPHLNDDTRRSAEHAAGLLLTALGLAPAFVRALLTPGNIRPS